MIIDIHAHIAYDKLYPASFFEALITDAVRFLPSKVDEEHKHRLVNLFFRKLLKDRDCSKLLEQMKEAGIAKTVLLIPDLEIALPDIEYSLDDIFKFYYDVSEHNPGKFIVFAGIDPRRGLAGLDLFQKAIINYKFKGLKLYPPCGFELDDNRLYPYYEICSYYGLPVMVHTGPSLSILTKEKEYSSSVIKIAKDFKKVKFILGHAGIKNYLVGVQLALANENVFLDVSSFQTEIQDLNTLKEKLLYVFNLVPDKILFGTDWPMFNLLATQKRWVDFFKQCTFLESNLDLFFTANAQRVFAI